MNNRSMMANNGTTVVSIISAFVVGGLLGAGIALLMAPQSGEKTRDLIASKSSDLKDMAFSKSSDLKDKALDTAEDTRHRARKAIKNMSKQTKERVSNLRDKAPDVSRC